jgi:glycosyltransferase involved in cell wall biosynthesis
MADAALTPATHPNRRVAAPAPLEEPAATVARARVFVVFLSPPSGRAYKGSRIARYLPALRARSGIARVVFHGLPGRSDGAPRDRRANYPAKILLAANARLPEALRFGQLWRFLAYMAIDLSAALRMATTLRRGDVLFTQPYFGFSLALARRRGARAVVENDVDHPFETLRAGFAERGASGFGLVERLNMRLMRFVCRNLPRADAVLCFSPHAKAMLEKHGVDPARIHVATPPIAPLSVAQETAAEPEFVWIGNDLRRKGLPALLEAWSAHVAAGGAGRLDIISQSPAVRDFLAAREGDARVAFLGNVSVVAYFEARRRILVIPSCSEGFPRVVLEACSAGSPVIASPAAGGDLFTDGENGWRTGLDAGAIRSSLSAAALLWPEIATIGDRARALCADVTGSYFDAATQVIAPAGAALPTGALRTGARR